MISALVGHLVGDYLLQNDEQALNKKKKGFGGFLACVVHCFIWTSCVVLFSGWYDLLTICILFGSHFVQDRTNVIRFYMKFIGQEAFATGPCAPWSVIVVDNVFHILTIWIIWVTIQG